MPIESVQFKLPSAVKDQDSGVIAILRPPTIRERMKMYNQEFAIGLDSEGKHVIDPATYTSALDNAVDHIEKFTGARITSDIKAWPAAGSRAEREAWLHEHLEDLDVVAIGAELRRIAHMGGVEKKLLRV